MERIELINQGNDLILSIRDNLDDLFDFAENSEELATLQAIYNRINQYTFLVWGHMNARIPSPAHGVGDGPPEVSDLDTTSSSSNQANED